ncbi:hypothetical protein IC229_14410 [Spirosoma sp. BT702]|uniref:Secretion system C-terminal sorting domain-containing protein n=1 Tax=Spirosoma profusum TaxID=2771354 RepID=A0A926Y3I0_9BACT|nr:hypothetical protein [Spirosoma profusum]MBD2701841.1 hypothetical protein [Spirosoma profusum]
MKTLIKSLALALTLGFVTVANTFADTNPGRRAEKVATFKTGIYTTTSGKLSIALDKEKGGYVDILLKNAEGKVLYSQRMNKNESVYRTRLNLSELPDGAYQLEITNGVDTTRQTVTIATKNPQRTIEAVAINN